MHSLVIKKCSNFSHNRKLEKGKHVMLEYITPRFSWQWSYIVNISIFCAYCTREIVVHILGAQEEPKLCSEVWPHNFYFVTTKTLALLWRERERIFCNGYLSLMYFCLESKVSPNSRLWCSSLVVLLVFSARKTENILNKETTLYRPNFFHLNESSCSSYRCGIRIWIWDKSTLFLESLGFQTAALLKST